MFVKINKLKKTLDNIGVLIFKNASIYDIKEGDIIKIISGKYSGMSGLILNINYSEETVDLELKIFGRIFKITEKFSSLEDPNTKDIIYPASAEEFRNFGHRGIQLLSNSKYIEYLYDINNEDLFYYIIYNVIYDKPESFFKLGFDNLKFLEDSLIFDFVLRLAKTIPDSIYLEKYINLENEEIKLRDIICSNLLLQKPKGWANLFRKYNTNDNLFVKFKQIILSNPHNYFNEIDYIRYNAETIDDKFVKFYFEQFLDKLTESGYGKLAFSTEYNVFEIEKYFNLLKKIAEYIKINNYEEYKEYSIEQSINNMEKDLESFRSREDFFNIENNIKYILDNFKNKKDILYLLNIGRAQHSLYYPNLMYLYDDAISKVEKE